MMRKGLALGRRGRKRTEAFYWGHLIDFWGRIFAFVLWCLYTYSVHLIINGCLSHISTSWERMGFGQERREEDGGKVQLIFENLDDLSHLYWDLCIH